MVCSRIPWWGIVALLDVYEGEVEGNVGRKQKLEAPENGEYAGYLFYLRKQPTSLRRGKRFVECRSWLSRSTVFQLCCKGDT